MFFRLPPPLFFLSVVLVLSWSANPEPDIAGYRVYYGTASRAYTQQVDAGNSTSVGVPNLNAGVTYFFAATAYNSSGAESGFSNEVSYAVPGGPSPSPTPQPSPSPTRTPTPIPSPTSSPSPTRSPSPTVSPSPTRTPSPSPTRSPSPSASPTPTATVSPSPAPSPSPTLSPTPTPGPITIGGRITTCGTNAPAVGVLVTISGSVSGKTLTDSNGNYSFSVQPGSSYVVSPSREALPAGSPAISTVDSIATMRFYLLKTPLVCIAAADATGEGDINSIDVVAIQRFGLGFESGLCGQYRFDPIGPTLDFSAVLIGDVQ